MDPLLIFKKVTIRLLFVDLSLICYMWLYGYFLNKSDSADTGIEIPVWFVIVMLFNLTIASISRFIPGRKRKGCSFQALEVFHYFVLFLRICAVPAFYDEYFEISLISILSLIAQCCTALFTANEFIQDQAPTRTNSSLNLNLEDSSWEVERQIDVKETEKEELSKSLKGGTSI